MDITTLLDMLRSDEGWQASAYQDHLGFWTIGYGFLIDSRKGGALPKEIAEAWLLYAANVRWGALTKALPWLLDQPEEVQVALGNMAYQMGVNGVLNFRKMLAALEAGDRKQAAVEALDSTWAQQTPSRAKRIAALIKGDT